MVPTTTDITFVISIIISTVTPQSDIEFQCMGANIIKSYFQPQSNIILFKHNHFLKKKKHYQVTWNKNPFLEIPISSLKRFRLHFYFPDTNFETQYTQTRKRNQFAKFPRSWWKTAPTLQVLKEGTRFEIEAHAGLGRHERNQFKKINSNVTSCLRTKLVSDEGQKQKNITIIIDYIIIT